MVCLFSTYLLLAYCVKIGDGSGIVDTSMFSVYILIMLMTFHGFDIHEHKDGDVLNQYQVMAGLELFGTIGFIHTVFHVKINPIMNTAVYHNDMHTGSQLITGVSLVAIIHFMSAFMYHHYYRLSLIQQHSTTSSSLNDDEKEEEEKNNYVELSA